MPLNLTWVDLAFGCTKSYPGQVKRHSLPFKNGKRQAVPLNLTWVDLAFSCTKSYPGQVKLNLTWVDLAFSCTKSYPGQVKRHSLPFQVEAALKYLVVQLTFAHDCTSNRGPRTWNSLFT